MAQTATKAAKFSTAVLLNFEFHFRNFIFLKRFVKMDPIEQLFQKAVNLINQEIVNFDNQLDILQRDLEDVLVEVNTPDSSNDEDIRQVRLHREQNQIVREFKG